MQRRTFLKAAGAAVGLQVIPLQGVAQDAKRKVRLAAIGTDGQARGDLKQMADEDFVAFCDVSEESLKWVREKYPNAKIYKDYRKMLAEVKDQIDAVTVITPDHIHHPAIMEAVKYNKHIFCEKPMTHTVAEGREVLTAVAAKKNLITQLGNQGHSAEGVRLMKEWIAAGAIGKPKELHAWCYEYPAYYYRSLDLLNQKPEIPDGLDWDLWQGPRPKRDYITDCVPKQWRGWMPYGNGVFADWVCHVVDGTFWALDLNMPTALTAEVDASYDPKRDAMIYPKGNRVTMEFTLKGGDPFKIIWYDGTMKVPRPADLEADREFDGAKTGAYLVGENGTLLHGSHGSSSVRIIPEAKMQAFQRPPKTIPRVKGGHCRDWLNAVRAGKHSNCAPFSYGGRLSEIGLLGTIAMRFPGQRLTYDEKAMRFTNSDDATKLLYPAKATNTTRS